MAPDEPDEARMFNPYDHTLGLPGVLLCGLSCCASGRLFLPTARSGRHDEGWMQSLYETKLHCTFTPGLAVWVNLCSCVAQAGALVTASGEKGLSVLATPPRSKVAALARSTSWVTIVQRLNMATILDSI